MTDKDFDNMIKNKVQNDKYIDKNVDQLFEIYKEKYKEERGNNMKEKSNILNFVQKMKYVAAGLTVGMVAFSGGLTYAHINGVETIISPVLRKIGINSKYEENATPINEVVTKSSVNVELLNMAADDSILIAGYKISSENIDMQNWLDIYGSYEVNGIDVKPVSQAIDKYEEGYFEYYQLFDLDEIDFEENVEINFVANIEEIKEYVECEDLYSNYAVDINKYTNKWNFNETIKSNNVSENKVYELEKDSINVNGIEISVEEIVRGSFTDMLKIKTDKSNYDGDGLDKYYIVYDENNNELASGKEDRLFDDRVYIDRLFLNNLKMDTKLRIDIFSQKVFDGAYEKVGSLNIDMSSAKEKQEEIKGYKKYDGTEYSFQYNQNWSILGIMDEDDVGKQSIYRGSLGIDIPSTTNDSQGTRIFIKKENKSDIEEYIEELVTGYKNEYHIIKSNQSYKIGNVNGYEVITELEYSEKYVNADYVFETNNSIYRITLSANEKEYNNQKDDIEKFIENFEVKK